MKLPNMDNFTLSLDRTNDVNEVNSPHLAMSGVNVDSGRLLEVAVLALA